MTENKNTVALKQQDGGYIILINETPVSDVLDNKVELLNAITELASIGKRLTRTNLYMVYKEASELDETLLPLFSKKAETQSAGAINSVQQSIIENLKAFRSSAKLDEAKPESLFSFDCEQCNTKHYAVIDVEGCPYYIQDKQYASELVSYLSQDELLSEQGAKKITKAIEELEETELPQEEQSVVRIAVITLSWSGQMGEA